MSREKKITYKQIKDIGKKLSKFELKIDKYYNRCPGCGFMVRKGCMCPKCF